MAFVCASILDDDDGPRWELNTIFIPGHVSFSAEYGITILVSLIGIGLDSVDVYDVVPTLADASWPFPLQEIQYALYFRFSWNSSALHVPHDQWFYGDRQMIFHRSIRPAWVAAFNDGDVSFVDASLVAFDLGRTVLG